MDEKEKALQRIRAGQFRENNGRVLKTINMLRHQFVRLKDVHTALYPLEEGAMLDSVNYLQEISICAALKPKKRYCWPMLPTTGCWRAS